MFYGRASFAFNSNSGGSSTKKTKTCSCKAEGRREIQPGSAEADAVCGPHVSGEARGKVKKSASSCAGNLVKQEPRDAFFRCVLQGRRPPVLSSPCCPSSPSCVSSSCFSSATRTNSNCSLVGWTSRLANTSVVTPLNCKIVLEFHQRGEFNRVMIHWPVQYAFIYCCFEYLATMCSSVLFNFLSLRSSRA